MIFNGFDFAPYMRCNMAKPVTPPVQVETAEVPGMDGVLVKRVRLQPLTIPVTARLTASQGDDMATVRHMLAAKLRTTKPAPLHLDDDVAKYYLAILDGETQLDTLWFTGQAELSFLCPDPVAYGDHRKTTVSGTKTIRPGGNYRAKPVVTVKPPSGSSWTITNVTTGEHVRVEASFTGAQTVIVDMGLERCTVNGSEHPISADSDCFALDGETQLKVSAGTATVEWDERWL